MPQVSSFLTLRSAAVARNELKLSHLLYRLGLDCLTESTGRAGARCGVSASAREALAQSVGAAAATRRSLRAAGRTATHGEGPALTELRSASGKGLQGSAGFVAGGTTWHLSSPPPRSDAAAAACAHTCRLCSSCVRRPRAGPGLLRLPFVARPATYVSTLLSHGSRPPRAAGLATQPNTRRRRQRRGAPRLGARGSAQRDTTALAPCWASWPSARAARGSASSIALRAIGG